MIGVSSPFTYRLLCAAQQLNSVSVSTPCLEFRDERHRSMGVIGFDIGRHFRGSGSRTQGYLVNAPCKTTGADSKRTDFALAA